VDREMGNVEGLRYSLDAPDPNDAELWDVRVADTGAPIVGRLGHVTPRRLFVARVQSWLKNMLKDSAKCTDSPAARRTGSVITHDDTIIALSRMLRDARGPIRPLSPRGSVQEARS
jgi:hypothetical protein